MKNILFVARESVSIEVINILDDDSFKRFAEDTKEVDGANCDRGDD